MTNPDLKEAVHRQPFQPFRIVLTTGTTYDILHPDLLMVGLRSAIVGITKNAEGTSYDRTIKVDLLHVVGIEALPVQQPPAANGPAA